MKMSNFKTYKSSLAVLGAIVALQASAADRIDVENKNTIRTFNLNVEQLLLATGSDTYVSYGPRKQLPKRPIKLRQYYHGVEVYGVSLAALPTENNGYTNISGIHIANIGKELPSAEPTISVEEALSKAINASSTFLTNTDVENIQSKLYVWLDENNEAHLAWFISFWIRQQSLVDHIILLMLIAERF